jgi:hypothetical protein
MTNHASLALLALATFLGCTSQIVIGTAETTSTGGGTTWGQTGTGFTGGPTTIPSTSGGFGGAGGAGGPTTTSGGGGYPAGTGTVTATDTISIPGCGSPPVTCEFTSSVCDCSALCAESSLTLEAVCTFTGPGTEQCDCYQGGNSLGSCTGAIPFGPYDQFEGCGGLGFGCCDGLLPVGP